LASTLRIGAIEMRFLLVTFFSILTIFPLPAQIKLQQNFEGPDSIPPGWGVYNIAPFPIDPEANWTVRDTGSALPGIATRTGKAHSGMRAIGVSWWAGIDTVTGALTQSDAWLITPRISNIQSGDILKFWATGGNGPAPVMYVDSLQVWLNGTDSLPSALEYHLASIVWPAGSLYGQFVEYIYDLSVAAGLDVWIGFRYYQDVTVDGFFVHVDDVSVEGPTSVDLIDRQLPKGFSLLQNYPNPFNPRTTVEFALARASKVSLKIFNTLGELTAELIDQEMGPGTFRAEWDASGLPSGIYFCRLHAGGLFESRKLVLLK